MPANVVVYTGPARSGKTWHLLGEFLAALASGTPAKAASRRPAGESDRGLVHFSANPHRPHQDLVGRKHGPAPLALAERGVWLAPTSRAVAEIRGNLIRGGLVACLHPGIMTFEELADRVLVECRSPLRPIPPAMQRELLRRIVQSACDVGQLDYFAEAAARPGFIDLLVEHLRELRRHDVAADDFARKSNKRGDPRQHRELARLCDDYERQLASLAFYDSDGRHRAARDALANDACPWPAELELVVVDGFTDFIPAQQGILEQLARRVRRLLISLPMDDGGFASGTSGPSDLSARSDLFAQTALTLAELRQLFPRLVEKQLPQRATPRPALDHLAAHLFRNPNQIPKLPTNAASPDRFEIVAAAGQQDEMAQIARRIKQRLLDDARPDDIVVVFRALGEAAPRVREVFTEFGIPFAIESGVPLMRGAVLRTLMTLLRLDAEDWPFRRVVSVLTNNSLTAFGEEVRAKADWLVRDLQIAKGRQALLERAGHLAAEAAALDEPGDDGSSASSRDDHFRRRALAARVALPALRLLANALANLPEQAPLADWTGALEELSVQLGLAPFAAASASGSAGAPPAAAEVSLDEESAVPTQFIDQVAWQVFLRHSGSLRRLDERLGQPPQQFTRREVLSLLIDLATHESLPLPHDEVGRVRVLSAATARTVAAPHLVLAGMSEQAFPSPERAGRLYASHDYRSFAKAANQERAELAGPFSRLGRAQEEMLLFYEVLTRATESLTISYPALDDKAQHLPPSSYEIEVERTLGRENIQHADPRLSPVPTDSNPYSVAEWRIQAVARALDGDPTLLAGLSANTETQDVAASIDAGLRIISHRGKHDRFSPFEGLLESPAIRDSLARQFGPDHLWSPSQWESYAACPYRFFLESILQLEPLGELTLETDHAHRGSLLHRVMASFHRCVRESLGASQPVSRHTREELKSKFDAALAAEIARLSPAGVDAALVELDRRQIEKWRDGYFDQIEKYDQQWADFTQPLTPAHFEVRFGPPRPGETDEDPRSTNQPFTLDIGGEEIRITGRIDRIDVGHIGGNTVFNIIDYKSGKRPTMNREHIESGERLQPPLYVMAAQAVLLDADNAMPLWAGYWSMKNGVTTDAKHSLQCSVDGVEPTEQWKDLHPKIIARVRQFVADIRHGDFPVFSRDDQCTEKCPFNTICRVNHIRSLNKTWPVETNSANTKP